MRRCKRQAAVEKVYEAVIMVQVRLSFNSADKETREKE